MCFTDGKKIGGVLDRNGLRPSRYFVTDDGLVLVSSEMGVLDIPEKRIIKKWRLEPGKIFLIDLNQKRIIDNDELKEKYSSKYNYELLLKKNQVFLPDIKGHRKKLQLSPNYDLKKYQHAFGYTKEDISFFINPIIKSGIEPTGSMGTDTPISILCNRPKLLYSYFKQCFAQVTNPPIDPIREDLVMSLKISLGQRPNIFSKPNSNNCFRLELEQPILTNDEIESIKKIDKSTNGKLNSAVIDILFKNSSNGFELKNGLEKICFQAKSQILEGKNILILSDKNISNVNAPIPCLLAASAVHHFLIKEGLRMKASLVVETGEARELHHFSVLFGYGIEAINPYLAFDTIKNLTDKNDWEKAENNFIKASQKAVLKIMSKMGISTLKSYCGAQIFDAIGISESVISKYFCGTSTLIGGINLNQIQKR